MFSSYSSTPQEKIRQVIANLTSTKMEEIIRNAKKNYVDRTAKGRGLSSGVEMALLAVGSLGTLGALTIAYSVYMEDSNVDYVTIGEKYRDNKVKERIDSARNISLNERNQIDPKLFLFNILNGNGENNIKSFKCYLCKELTCLPVENDGEAQSLIYSCLLELYNYPKINVTHLNKSSNELIIESETIYKL